MDKKQEQLGMNPGTASNRLVKDLLYSMLQDKKCYLCKEHMERENFSIEHKIPWLDSEDPIGLFFDLDNIAFSHRSCNSSRGRRPNKIYNSLAEARKVRREREKQARANLPRELRQQKRRDQYLRTGK